MQQNYKETITLTFGDCGENHVGMQKIGKIADCGFSIEKMKQICSRLDDLKIEYEYFNLHENIEENVDCASFLLIKNGINLIMDDAEYANKIFEEQTSLEWDKKVFMYGRVVNKHARHNLCYDAVSQEPDYEKKKGTIVDWNRIQCTQKLKNRIEEVLQCDALIGEGNRYFDVSKCGIGYHGDTERRIVVGCRIGESMPLCFQWFHKSLPVGKKFEISIGNADIYIMSDKAVGYDWKSRSKYTLRHAAGCKKFTEFQLKKKKEKK